VKVSVNNLHRSFGKTHAVQGISFEFGSGQIFGFIGPNGAGKTTTMRILATLDEPTDGDAKIDGVSVVEHPERARQRVGFMPDMLPAHRDMSVHDYLDFFARAYGLERPYRSEAVEQVEQFANLMGIREKTLKALSKGMKQRVSLARAIIHDPPLLILDEPAAGLDPRARVELRELLRALAQQGKAILISSHILTELSEICGGAVIIEHGEIVAAGTLDDLLLGKGRTGEDGGGAIEAEPQVRVQVRVLSPAEALHKAMLEMPHVGEARIVNGHVEATVAGTEEVACELLAELIRRDFKVLEFKQHRAGLEEIFMNVTRGEVS
jgi:ABC-2 type transport system ATP-binding protein